MTKKKDPGIKNLVGYIPILTIAVGLITAFVKMSLSADEAKTKIAELKTDVKEAAIVNDKDIKDLKTKDAELERKVEVNKVQQDNIEKSVHQVDSKVDKIYDVLVQMQKKK